MKALGAVHWNKRWSSIWFCKNSPNTKMTASKTLPHVTVARSDDFLSVSDRKCHKNRLFLLVVLTLSHLSLS